MTHLCYLEDFNRMSLPCTVTNILTENDRSVVLLDKTIFYPQGGGQPYDTGTMKSATALFIVEEVRFVDGIVRHSGRFERGTFTNGEIVQCAVDKERRNLHSRLHSAGHVVDMAVAAVKYDWKPGKGYHFPDGPYVEYEGRFELADKEAIKHAIEQTCNQYIQRALATKLLFMDKEKMGQFCRFVPDYIPENKPARVVMYGEFGVPCGGTHVSNLKDIGCLSVRKLRTDGTTIRVSYEIERK